MTRRHMMAAAIAVSAVMSATGVKAAVSQTAASISDPVLFWNNQMLNMIRDARTPPPPASRVMAMMHTAIYDAVNAASGSSYKSYSFTSNAYAGADANVAAAVAAHRVLVEVYPAQVATLDSALSSYLASGSNSPAAVLGAQLGKASADSIINQRRNDGSSATVNYTYGTGPGVYQNTAGTSSPPLFQQFATTKTWTMTSQDQFRAEAPPALDSEQYASAYNEVKALGAANSSERTADQSQIATYWADGGGTATPPGHWLQIAQDIALEKGQGTLDNARLFAMLAVSVADAAISCWDTKAYYNFWRPVTAIQNGSSDGNDATIGDTAWNSYIATPMFQSYTSGHSSFSGAAAEILSQFFGSDSMHFCSAQEGNASVVRCWDGFSAAADEAGMSRVYGGIHFRFDSDAGLSAGRNIARQVASNYFTAVPEPATLGLMGSGLIGAGWMRRRRRLRG